MHKGFINKGGEVISTDLILVRQLTFAITWSFERSASEVKISFCVWGDPSFVGMTVESGE